MGLTAKSCTTVYGGVDYNSDDTTIVLSPVFTFVPSSWPTLPYVPQDGTPFDYQPYITWTDSNTTTNNLNIKRGEMLYKDDDGGCCVN